MKRNKGFTIIEIMITVAVLAIFLALSLNVGRSSMQRATFTAAVNQFVADFYYARQLASIENRYVAIVFNNNGRSYEIVVQRDIETLPTADPATYVVNKTVVPITGADPDRGDLFFDGAAARDFAFNSTGVVRAFPVVANSDPISFNLTFFRLHGDSQDGANAVIDYQRTIWVYPSGGVKIENTKR